MTEVTAEAEQAMSAFQETLESVEAAIRPLLSAVESLKTSEDPAGTPALTRARMHATLAYAVNALYYMYLRANGIESDEHPVLEDITKIQNVFSRLRAVERSLKSQSGEKSAESKQARSARKALRGVDAFLTPEEDGLFHALKGATAPKERHKRFSDDKEGEQGEDEAGDVEMAESKSVRKKRKKEKLAAAKQNAGEGKNSDEEKVDAEGSGGGQTQRQAGDADAAEAGGLITPEAKPKKKKSKSSKKKKKKMSDS